MGKMFVIFFWQDLISKSQNSQKCVPHVHGIKFSKAYTGERAGI